MVCLGLDSSGQPLSLGPESTPLLQADGSLVWRQGDGLSDPWQDTVLRGR